MIRTQAKMVIIIKDSDFVLYTRYYSIANKVFYRFIKPFRAIDQYFRYSSNANFLFRVLY